MRLDFVELLDVANLLNIAALSRRTGVAPDTLRKWELRYGVLCPTRTGGGQRRYTEHDVARVEWLRDRLREGWRIGEASRVLQESETPALDDPVELRDALIEAARSTTPAEIEPLLDQTFAVLPYETALSDVIVPALRWVGDEWHGGRITVAQEHALSAKVRARLQFLLSDTRGGVLGTAVLACAPGEQHEIGLLMIALLLRADGWHVEYLGQDTPVAEAYSFARSVGATLLCVSAARRESLEALQAGLAAIEPGSPPALVAGGRAVGPEEAQLLRAAYVPGDFTRTAARLRRLAAA
jgi:DNA-binding transcriptional MerR regulator